MTTFVLIVLAVLWTLVLAKPMFRQSRAADEPPTRSIEPADSEQPIRYKGVRRVLAFFGLLEDERHESPWWLRGSGGFGGFGGGGCHGGGGR